VAIPRAHSRHQAPSPLAGSDAKALYGGLAELHLDGADRLDSEGSYFWGAPVSTPLAQSSRVYFGGFAPDFPHYISGKKLKKMKTFIVYDLDSQIPVAVGEQISAETARYCASVATGIFQANLLAEEIDLEKQITY
jgi:hypothetical protein